MTHGFAIIGTGAIAGLPDAELTALAATGEVTVAGAGDAASRCSVEVSAMVDADALDGPGWLVDAVDHPVRAAPRGIRLPVAGC